MIYVIALTLLLIAWRIERWGAQIARNQVSIGALLSQIDRNTRKRISDREY